MQKEPIVQDADMLEEKVKQIALKHFYSYYVKRDIEEALTCVGRCVQWVGSKEHYVAHNREEWRTLLEKEIEKIPPDCMMKVLMTEVLRVGADCYNVLGELELRLPYPTSIHYSTLRFALMIMEKNNEFVIVSIHTSTTGKSVLKEEDEQVEIPTPQFAKDLQNSDYYDSVTGLVQLDEFKLQMKKRLEESSAEKKYVLICTDVDKFELVNNLYGLKKADAMLAELATMLTTCSKSVEISCRSVADHFLCLISYEHRDEIFRLLHALCIKFNREMKQKYSEAEPRLGIAALIVEDPTMAIEKMVECVNMTRKSLQTHAKSSIVFYDPKLLAEHEKVMHIERNMQRALVNHEFQAYMQPKYDLETGKIVGAEALVRWIRPDGSMIYPNDFIPIFESNGFIAKLDFYMLGEVCRMLKRRIEEKRPCMPISINQSRVLLQDRNYVKNIAGVLERHNTPPRFIELELTERIFRDDLKELADMMGKLRDLGIRWSIDDFGTGYSSLNLLKELPVDIIKIDKSFLDETESSEASKIIIRKTVELSQELDMTVICEGVETETQADYLRGIRCDIAQGYLYAKPMPMEEFEDLLDKEMAV